MFAYVMMCDLRAHLLMCSVVFDQNQHDLCATSSYSPHLAPSNFFCVSLDEKVLKGKLFTDVEELKHKTAEALKDIKINKFKNCFEQWKNCLNRCITSNGSSLKGTEV